MKKITEINYRTNSGADITVKVTRNYGREIQEVWVDQYVKSEVFVDSCILEVSVNGGEYKECQLTTCQGYNVVRYTDNKAKKAYNVIVREDKLNEIKSLMAERLTEEVSNEEKEEIELVKNAVEKGNILPKSVLAAKRAEYKAGMLEGGDGYNPYDHYISAEYLQITKNKYPDLFKK